jgi:hypothetical protein
MLNGGVRMSEYIKGTGINSWPVPVAIYEGKETLVKISGLPQARKLTVWAEIKNNCPELADLLKDPALQDVVKMFSADIFIEAIHAPSLPTERLRGRGE